MVRLFAVHYSIGLVYRHEEKFNMQQMVPGTSKGGFNVYYYL
jgi:hypothetical protein